MMADHRHQKNAALPTAANTQTSKLNVSQPNDEDKHNLATYCLGQHSIHVRSMRPGSIHSGLSFLEGRYLNWNKEIGLRRRSHPRYMGAPRTEDERAAMYWAIDGGPIHLAIAARAEGWVAFEQTL